MAEIPREIEMLRMRIAHSDSVRVLSGIDRKSWEEKLDDFIFNKPTIVARSEIPAEDEALDLLLQKVDGIRSWLLENGRKCKENNWLVYSFGAELFSAATCQVTPGIPRDDLSLGQTLFLHNEEEEQEVVINFFFGGTFILELGFLEGAVGIREGPIISRYTSAEQPFKEMTKEEHRIIEYYCELFTKRFIKQPTS